MNKSLIFFAALLLTCNLLKAQTSQGTQNLGLDLGLTALHSDEQSSPVNPGTPNAAKSTLFNIGPAYSYFVSDKVDIGARFSYSGSDYSNSNLAINPPTSSIKTIYGSVYLRKYFLFDDKIGIRTGPFAAFSHQTNNETFSGGSKNNSSVNEIDAGVNMDLVYYPTKHLGFAANIATLQYEHHHSNFQAGNVSTNGVVFSTVSSGLLLSVFYIFH